jgi:hypothetical protein
MSLAWSRIAHRVDLRSDNGQLVDLTFVAGFDLDPPGLAGQVIDYEYIIAYINFRDSDVVAEKELFTHTSQVTRFSRITHSRYPTRVRASF